ncbi:SUKH-3 domain-containing protein [Streptomyces sp. NPDC101194]|uniref:SUKH-3 domain-containing protein n=1 Tax=Streptomyces sp. NPDC101194 TaxID=3366127 RepID=UPI00380BD6F5
MSCDQLAPEVRAWLITNGWSPGRDIAERTDELIQVRVQDARRQGFALTPVPAAVHAILCLSSPDVTTPRPTAHRS